MKKTELIVLVTLTTGILVTFCGKKENSASPTGTGTDPATGSPSNGCTFSELDTLSLTAIYNHSGSKIPDTSVNSSEVNWQLLTPTDAPSFSGTGRYHNCSGTLLETNGNDRSAPAYVLTNGHCIGASLPSADEVILDRSEPEGKKLYLSYYAEYVAANKVTAIPAKSVAFASMHHTDVAIVELDSSLAELKAKGFCAYPLAASRPSAGQDVFMAGVPLTGVSLANVGLHYAHCSVGETVAIWEGNYRFLDSFRHRCSIVGGNSGTALFARDSKKIVGVVNTTVNDSSLDQADCTLDKPCEKDKNGESSIHPMENYGQYVDFLAGCFAPSGHFDRSQEGCGISAKFEGMLLF